MQAKSLEFLQRTKKNIVSENYKEALLVGEVFKYLKIPYAVFPDFRASFGDDLRSFRNEIFELNNALFKFYNENAYFVSPYSTILKKLPAKKYYKSITLEFADEIDLEKLKKELIYWGYERVDIVSEKVEATAKPPRGA
jgi:transcription-repair coupling factor (superfamily II helicase)